MAGSASFWLPSSVSCLSFMRLMLARLPSLLACQLTMRMVRWSDCALNMSFVSKYSPSRHTSDASVAVIRNSPKRSPSALLLQCSNSTRTKEIIQSWLPR
eukprot:3438711-Amphidinium_carterae.1